MSTQPQQQQFSKQYTDPEGNFGVLTLTYKGDTSVVFPALRGFFKSHIPDEKVHEAVGATPQGEAKDVHQKVP